MPAWLRCCLFFSLSPRSCRMFWIFYLFLTQNKVSPWWGAYFHISFNQRSFSRQQRCYSTELSSRTLFATQKLNPETEDMKINIIISTTHLLHGIGWIRSAQVDTISLVRWPGPGKQLVIKYLAVWGKAVFWMEGSKCGVAQSNRKVTQHVGHVAATFFFVFCSVQNCPRWLESQCLQRR